MIRLFQSLQLSLFVLVTSSLSGQGTTIPFIEHFPENYSECAAIIFNDGMLVESYSPDAICSLADTIQGLISVATVEFADDVTIVKKTIPFRWAIKNLKTGTILSVDADVKSKIQFSEMLQHCGMDDSIVIMTVSPSYSLPHNEIVIRRRC